MNIAEDIGKYNFFVTYYFEGFTANNTYDF